MSRPSIFFVCWAMMGVVSAVGCAGGRDELENDPAAYDSLPALINDSLPFDYPVALYILKKQGDVTLRVHIDKDGRIVPESTSVFEKADSFPQLDTAAMVGATKLVFRPAYRDGKPVGITVLFPVQFRVPGAGPMPQDTAASPAKP
jgi:TonB family protein